MFLTLLCECLDVYKRQVQENLTGIRVVKSFIREKFEIKKFNHVSDKIFKTFSKAEGIVAYNMPLMQLSLIHI